MDILGFLESMRKASSTEIHVDNKLLQDTDIIVLKEWLRKNTKITKLIIQNHNLTAKSYPVLIEILKENAQIYAFSCKPTSLSLPTALFNREVQAILDARSPKVAV